MASGNQRRKNQDKVEAVQEEDIFGIDDELASEISQEFDPTKAEDYRIRVLSKSGLHFLFLIHHPRTTLSPGDPVYIGRKGEDPEPYTVLPNGRLQKGDEVFTSLSAAVKFHRRMAKNSWPDGWGNVRVPKGTYRGGYTSLNEYWESSWLNFRDEVSLEVLESNDRMYDLLCGMGLQKYADLYHSKKGVKGKKPVPKKAKKVSPSKAKPQGSGGGSPKKPQAGKSLPSLSDYGEQTTLDLKNL